MKGEVKIAKYVNVRVTLNKIIKVDSESESNVIQKAKEKFYENELNSEYLDARKVMFEENKFVSLYAEELSSNLYNLYKENLTYDQVKENVESLFKVYGEFSECVLEETLNILADKYNLDLKNTVEKEMSI